MSRYTIAPEAILDLDEISNYFFVRDIEAGERWFQTFDQKCRQLVQFPLSGRSYAIIRSDLRGLPLEGFIIFYRVQDTIIEIMRVISGKSDLKTLFTVDE